MDKIIILPAQVAELVDALVSNTNDSNIVPVRPRPWVPDPFKSDFKGVFCYKVKCFVVLRIDLSLPTILIIKDGLRSLKEWHVELLPNSQNRLDKRSVADCFQIESLSKDRFISKRGKLSLGEIESVKLCLMKVLDLL